MQTIIRNATIVNEGKKIVSDVLIKSNRIEKVSPNINLNPNVKFEEHMADGLHLIPGMIDDQVHFREPGLTAKGTIYSESKAAVAGGITSYMEMPNTIPNCTTLNLLEEKYTIAANTSLANYSFFMGINQHNLEEALKIDNENICGLSDDGLYFNDNEGILANYPVFLEKLFSRTESLVALHSEDDSIIKKNLKKYQTEFSELIPAHLHAKIRSEEACFIATERVLEIANMHQTRLHLLHISTMAEATLFSNNIPVRDKRITAEACVHHLWFSEKDYTQLGNKIKWNPSIKTEKDKNGLLEALNNNLLDNIATDHAPHLLSEKEGNYHQVKSGAPLVQHGLPTMFELFHQGKITLEKIVEKTSHHVAEIYRIKDRGYIREGYFADLVLVDLHNAWKVNSTNIAYKCNWSPFDNFQFKSKIKKTFVNGQLIYNDGIFIETIKGGRLKFESIR